MRLSRKGAGRQSAKEKIPFLFRLCATSETEGLWALTVVALFILPASVNLQFNHTCTINHSRYVYKAKLGEWKTYLKDALDGSGQYSLYECKSRLVLYESLQACSRQMMLSALFYVSGNMSTLHSWLTSVSWILSMDMWWGVLWARNANHDLLRLFNNAFQAWLALVFHGNGWCSDPHWC